MGPAPLGASGSKRISSLCTWPKSCKAMTPQSCKGHPTQRRGTAQQLILNDVQVLLNEVWADRAVSPS